MLVVSGSNFSGRSALVREKLLDARRSGPVAFLGSSNASLLSGLTTTVGSELAMYSCWGAAAEELPWADYLFARARQRIASLSGGEQVLLGLAVLGRRGLSAVGVDSALEQLDAEWRKQAWAYLSSVARPDVSIIDNRLTDAEATAHRMHHTGTGRRWQLHGGLPVPQHFHRGRVDLAVSNIAFRYSRGPLVFRDATFRLEAGHAYRLAGPNGSGKTTLIRILCGVLPPQGGVLEANGVAYRPCREGNRIFALSMQNPDEQWTDVTLFDDFRRRLRVAAASGMSGAPEPEAIVGHWIEAFGEAQLFRGHVLDAPPAMRKRLSWLWALSGCLPWLVFDEPSLGQDDATVEAFAGAVRVLLAAGHGVIIISHDERLMARVPHRQLDIANHSVVVT